MHGTKKIIMKGLMEYMLPFATLGPNSRTMNCSNTQVKAKISGVQTWLKYIKS
jgi:hypothetical protein